MTSPARAFATDAAPRSPARKPLGTAREVSSQAPLSASVVAVAREQSRPDGSVQQKKYQRTQGHPVESRLSWVGIRVHPADREEIKRQLFRCIGKYDPRAIPRIISKRTGITEQAVDYALQQTVREYDLWAREIRASLARADEVSQAAWKRGAA